MADVILPAECLAEYKLELAGLQSGNAVLPPWLSQADVPRLIRETEDKIKSLEAHLARWGNTWEVALYSAELDDVIVTKISRLPHIQE